MLTAVIDDSADDYGDDEPVFVLAGCIADAENWDKFTGEWQERLRLVHPSDAFKMSEVAQRWGADDERIMFFYRVIEKYVFSTFCCVIPVRDYERALARYPGKLEPTPTLYQLAFWAILDRMCRAYGELGYQGQIKFVFDQQQNEDAKVLARWDTVLSRLPSGTQDIVARVPAFESDHEFLPLQAADLLRGGAGNIGKRTRTKGSA